MTHREDRYGLTLATTSDTARDAYVAGCDLLLRGWPGALPLLDQAIAADPGFALAHVARGRVLQLGGDAAGAAAAFAAAEALPDLGERGLGQVAAFRLAVSGQWRTAIDAVKAHVARWPRDALVATLAANLTGLIAVSGLPGRERMLLDYLEGLAPHYGDDWWFNAHYGMALSELGYQQEAWPRLEVSRAGQPLNGSLAHAIAHWHYEEGDAESAIGYLRDWLPAYPRHGGLYGHLSWHLSVALLNTGEVAEGLRLFDEAFGADPYPGPAMIKVFDSCAFLWRAELAGHARDPERWAKARAFCHSAFPRPGFAFTDWHVALAEAVAGKPEPRAAAIAAMVAEGRYHAGPAMPGVSRGLAAFERGDYEGAIAGIAPAMATLERLGGSRAQQDLFVLTLVKAYLETGRLAEARELLGRRRPRATHLPVAGAAAVLH